MGLEGPDDARPTGALPQQMGSRGPARAGEQTRPWAGSRERRAGVDVRCDSREEPGATPSVIGTSVLIGILIIWLREVLLAGRCASE